MLKNKKSTLSKILFIIICVIGFALIAIYIIPRIIVMFAVGPSLVYQIKESQGCYPSVRELGDAFWSYNDPEIDIELITIDGEILGEISTKESSFAVKGKFLYSTMYLYCSHQNNTQENLFDYSQHTIIEADYAYVEGEIVCSNLKTDLSHLDFSKDFTLKKEKNIDKKSSEVWQCDETNIQLWSYSEIDEYYTVEFLEKNEEFQLIKLWDNYYELTFSPGGYVVYVSMQNQDGKISLEIVSTYINKKRTFELYMPDEIKTLTFVQS